MSFACPIHDLIGHTVNSFGICLICTAGSAEEQIMMITRSSPAASESKGEEDEDNPKAPSTCDGNHFTKTCL